LLAANEAQLVDLSCNENLKGKFSDSSLSISWLNAATVYSKLSDIALSTFLQYSTTYLCGTVCAARFIGNEN